MTVPTRPRLNLDDAADSFLVERASDGDVASFEALARRYGPLMRGYARRLTGSTADADDAVQETLLQAWNLLGELQDGDAVKPWLMRICGRKSIDLIRKRKYPVSLDDVEPSDLALGPERAVEQDHQMRSLVAALKKLPGEQRHCWVLKEMGGQSYEDIAETLDITTDSVRGRLSRARTTLMKEMEDWR